MTEQIKSAIHCMRTSQDIEVCEECPIYGEVGTDHCFEESCRIAENSLKAWDEVLNELYKIADDFNDFGGLDYASGLEKAIGTIKEKLSEVAE